MLTNLVVLNNPFNLNDRDIKKIEIDDEIGLDIYLEKYVPVPPGMEYHASINGRVYTSSELPLHVVREYDSVVVCPVIKGGDSGSNVFAILAGIALAVFSFGVVAPFVGGLLGTVAGNIAAGLTMMIGGQLISNAFSPSLKSNNEEVDETSSGWEMLQSIAQQGAVIPITYGTVRTAGQILNQHVEINNISDLDTLVYAADADDADEYLYMLLCGGEGPIDSFSDFRINDNPAQNYDCTPVTRRGDNTQTCIPGHGAIYSTQAVQVTLNGNDSDHTQPGDWHTVEYTGDSADAIEVIVSFPQGLCSYDGKSSTPKSNWVEIQLQYCRSSGVIESWQDLSPTGTVKVTATKTTPFAHKCWYVVNFTASTPSEKLKIRARVYAKENASSVKSIDTVQWTVLSGVLMSAQTHPNKALVGVKIKATDQLNGGTPTITWKQTRSNVWVYDGVWMQKDAQNPAWIIYDLIVHARSLDGTIHVFGENPSRIDLPAFKAWANWNDRELNNRPALKMNLLVDESKSLWEWCNDIASSARGAVVLKGTRISCIFDAPSDPVQLFSMGNISAGSFSGEFLSVEERANAIEIAFNNEDNNFEREQITVYADGFDDDDSRANPVSVQLTGITDFERAYREGFYRLNQNKYLIRTITFTADVDAIACQVGDVILVQHDIPQWGQGGRVLSINGQSLTLDKEVTFNPGKAYVIIIRKNNDERIQRYVTGTGTTNTVSITSGDLSGVSPYDVFAIGQVDKAAKPFRVQVMERTGDLQVTLTCTEYIAEVYTDATNIPVIQYSDSSTNGITGLQIISTGYYTESGQWIPEVWAYWNYIGERPARYEVQWSYDDGIWQSSVTLTDSRAQCAIRSSQTLYKVRVRALYVTGLPSSWSYATAQGLRLAPSVPPDPPTGLQATGWFGYASLTWVNPSAVDFDHIEVWEATEDDLTKAVHIGNTPADSYTRLLPTGGAFWYWVRAVNFTGLKSEFNSQAGTPCIISARDHETYVTQLLEDNPYLQETLDDVTSRIEPIEIKIPQLENEITDITDVQIPALENDIADITDITIPSIEGSIENIRTVEIPSLENDIADITEVAIPSIHSDIANINNVEIPQLQNDIEEINDIKIPDLTGKVTDSQNNINNILFPTLERVGEGILRLSDESVRTRNVFRWAGFEVDEDEGTVVIRALEDLRTETGYQFSDVTQRLDAQSADINLKATRIYVDELAASLISSVIVAESWKFNGSLRGWTGQNATLTAESDGIKYKITASSPSMTSPDITVSGAVNNIVGLQLQQLSGNANFTVRIQYKTSAHSYSDSYMKRVEILGSVSVVRSVQVDMHALSYGGNDWKNSTITGIRILIDDTVNSEYLVPLVNIGQSSMSDLIVAGLETRISQAEADIDGANAAIALKADTTTVTALSQKLTKAEVNIDGLNGAIALKADRAELTETNARVQTAEVRIGALEGTISQEVSDLKILQDQIDSNSDAIIQNALNHATGEEHRRIALAEAKQELHAEITGTNEALAQAKLDLLASIDETVASIEQERTARAQADSAEAQARETLASQVGENKAAIQSIEKTRVDDKNAESYSQRIIQAQINELADATAQNALNDAEGQEESRRAVAQAKEELYAKIDESDKASAGYRLELLAKIDENDAQYQHDIQSVSTALSAETTARETLAVTVASNTAGLQTEAQTRASEDSALSTRINTTAAGVAENEAAIQSEATARAQADSAEAQARETLASQVGENKAAIQSIEKTRVDDKNAESYSQRIIQAQINELADATAQNALNDAEGQEEARRAVAQAKEELYAKIDESDKASAGYRLELLAKIDENDAQYQTDIQSISTALSAETTARETLAVTVATNTAGIQSESQARASGDSSLSSRIDTVAAGVGENKAAIQNIEKTRVDDKNAESYSQRIIQAQINELADATAQNALNDAEGQEESRRAVAQAKEELYAKIDESDKASAGYRLELLAKIDENDAQYQRDIQSVSTALSAETTARETLAVTVASNTAGLQTEAQTRASEDSALSTRINTTAAGVASNTAAIQSEVTARADADTAEAQARQTLQSTVDGHTTAIQSLDEVKEGIVGKHLLKIDSNGYVAGYELYNGGDSKSSFTIAADKFLISPPNRADPKDIFVYDTTTASLHIRNVTVDTAQIADGAIQTAKIAGGAITGAKIADSTITGSKIAGSTITGSNIVDATIGRAKIPMSAITDKAAAISNTTETYEVPSIWVPETEWEPRSIKPNGLSLTMYFYEALYYNLSSCFVINGYSGQRSDHVGICYTYLMLQPGASSAIRLYNQVFRIPFSSFQNGIPLTIPFQTTYVSSGGGYASFKVALGVYTSSVDFADPINYTTGYGVNITLANKFFNIFASYR